MVALYSTYMFVYFIWQDMDAYICKWKNLILRNLLCNIVDHDMCLTLSTQGEGAF